MINDINSDTTSFEETAKKLGLVEIATGEAIDKAAFGILNIMHKDVSAILKPIRLDKPEEPKRLEKPEEPMKPEEPIQLQLNGFLEHLSDEDKKDLTKNLVAETKKYQEDLKKYQEDLKKYKKDIVEYEKQLPFYLKEMEQYEKDLNHYFEREKKYKEYEEEVKEAIELNSKIESVYKKWTNNSFLKSSKRDAPVFLKGPPGHGKTTAFRIAAQRVSKALGMRYIEDPTDGTYIDKSTFVFCSLQLGGQVTTTGLAGIPSKNAKLNEKGEVDNFMTLLPEYRISSLNKAGGSLLLLDDFSNASETIQNGIGLQLVNEGKLNGLSLLNTYIGLTGNLGNAYDGTNTFKTSAALSSRTQTYAVRDRFEPFQERVLATTSDPLGDAYVVSFFELNPNRFGMLEKRGEKQGGSTSPRSIENFIHEARNLINRKGGVNNIFKNTKELSNLAIAMLGVQNGKDYETYLHAINNEALPHARKLVQTKEFTKIDKIKGVGSESEKNFIHYYKTALVSEVALAYRKGNITIDDIGEIYCKACLNFTQNESNLSDLFQQMTKSLCLSIPEIRDVHKDNASTFKFTHDVNLKISKAIQKTFLDMRKNNSSIVFTEEDYEKIQDNFLNHGTAVSSKIDQKDFIETDCTDEVVVSRRRNSLK